jgi:hypothetical protein
MHSKTQWGLWGSFFTCFHLSALSFDAQVGEPRNMAGFRAMVQTTCPHVPCAPHPCPISIYPYMTCNIGACCFMLFSYIHTPLSIFCQLFCRDHYLWYIQNIVCSFCYKVLIFISFFQNYVYKNEYPFPITRIFGQLWAISTWPWSVVSFFKNCVRDIQVGWGY